MKNKKTNRKVVAVISIMMLLVMVLPQAAFAGSTSGDIPVYLTTEETDSFNVTDVVISDSLTMISDGDDGEFGAGTITVTNNRSVGSVSVDKIVYTDNASVTGWMIVKDSNISPGMAVNSRKYSLLVKTGDTTGDLSSAVNVGKGVLLAAPEDDLDLEFSGNLSAVTSNWTKVPIGKVVLTLSLYQDDEVFQIRMADGVKVSVITDDGTLYSAAGKSVNVNLTNLGTGEIASVKIINADTSAELQMATITKSKYNFTMPSAPVIVTPTIS